MNPCEQAWKAAVDASHVLAAVERRLVDAGALTELRQLHGLSAQEQDVLVYRELYEPPATCEETPSRYAVASHLSAEVAA